MVLMSFCWILLHSKIGVRCGRELEDEDDKDDEESVLEADDGAKELIFVLLCNDTALLEEDWSEELMLRELCEEVLDIVEVALEETLEELTEEDSEDVEELEEEDDKDDVEELILVLLCNDAALLEEDWSEELILKELCEEVLDVADVALEETAEELTEEDSEDVEELEEEDSEDVEELEEEELEEVDELEEEVVQTGRRPWLGFGPDVSGSPNWSFSSLYILKI